MIRPSSHDHRHVLARAHHELADEAADESRREVLLRDGLALAERALALDPAEGACHKWLGIMLGKYGDFLDTKTKVR